METSDTQSKLDLLLAENQQLREWIANQKLATKQWYAFLGLVVLLSVIFTLSYDFVIDNPEYPVGLWVGFLLTIGVWHGLSLRSFLERWKRTLVASAGVTTPSLLIFSYDHPLLQPMVFLLVFLVFFSISLTSQWLSRYLRFGIQAPDSPPANFGPVGIRTIFGMTTAIALWLAGGRWYLIYATDQQLSYSYFLLLILYVTMLGGLLALTCWSLRKEHVRRWKVLLAAPLFSTAVCIFSMLFIITSTRLLTASDAQIYDKLDTFEKTFLHRNFFVLYSILVAVAPTITAVYLAFFGHRIVKVPTKSVELPTLSSDRQ